MPQPDADRNLLLGILAQQMDFVTRDALFEATNAWTTRKETPLGALLVERGDLAKSRRDLLEALVDEHVRAHGGDPARSLQALSSVGPVAEDLGCLTDAAVQARVSHLRIPGTIYPSSDPFATRVPMPFDGPSADYSGTRISDTLGNSTSWNGRFRVVRPHARGGLGVVSVALDDELDREVAFKEIKDEYADHGGSRARFVLEAEITGKLEHPGIIPIYGLGQDPTGRPFYAMRFIRGDSLADAINRYHDPNGPYVKPEKKSLQLRELLGRFLDVCDAMAYAHSRGVLHRDLKPGNVMLGPFGETLVVDWGLALPLERIPEGHESTHGAVKSTKADSSSLPSEQGAVVGTPAYMPPEQAEGALDRLGPWSDVYSLGAILYELLTGKRPVEGSSLEQVLRRVGQGEIQPPRQVRPEITPALESVCLKALALKPEDRYPTPRALAADVKAWLADEPVSTRPEPFAERARRWAKRNRTAVTAAAAALLVGLVGLGAVAAVQTKGRNELGRKNHELTIANKAFDEQRKRAEDRETQAIDAVKKFRDTVANEAELKNTPSLEGLRKRLLKEPLAFFRALRDRLQADRDIRTESLARLADASFDLGYLTNEIGDKQDALSVYRESLAIREKLSIAHPTVTAYWRGLAASQNNIGNLLRETGKPLEALKAFEAMVTIYRKLADENPTVADFRSGLALSHNNIGVTLHSTGKPAEALKSHDSALAIRQKLADDNPTVTQFQSDLADSYLSIGSVRNDMGDPVEALESYGHELEIRQKLADDNSTVNQFLIDLSRNLYNIGIVQEELGKPVEALASYGRALAIRQKLVDDNPAVTNFRKQLANIHNFIGNLMAGTGRPAEALKSLHAALAIRQKLADDNPTVTEYQNNLAGSHNNLGLRFREQSRPAEALESYGRALSIMKKLTDDNPTVTYYCQDLAEGFINVGQLHADTGQMAEAVDAFTLALPIIQKLTREHPESSAFAIDLGKTLTGLAIIDTGAKRFEEARVRLREAIVWERKALASNPANPSYWQLLGNSLMNMALANRGLGDTQGEAEAWRELAAHRASDPAMKALDARLPAILRGDQQPKDNRERLRFAQRAYDKALHAAAAKLRAEALEADPNLAEDRTGTRYNAACAAALAGCGQGKDVPAIDDAAKAKLREQARAWLQAELAAWTKLLESGPAAARPVIVRTLKHWGEDSDLAGIRDEAALASLPEAERQGLRALWADVEALRKKAEGR